MSPAPLGMPDIGLPPAWRRRSFYLTLNLAESTQQVLGQT